MTNLVTEGFDWVPEGVSNATRDRLFGAKGWYGVGDPFPAYFEQLEGRFEFGSAVGRAAAPLSNSSLGYYYLKPYGAQSAIVYGGIAVYRDEVTEINCSPYVGAMDGVNVKFHVRITFDKNGVIRVYRGGDQTTIGTLLGTSDLGVFRDENWWFCEYKILIDETVGEVEVRVNTKTVIHLINVDTKDGTGPTSADAVVIGFLKHLNDTTIVGFRFDDIYVNDDQGTVNNDFLGNVRTKSQFMIGDGSNIDFLIGGTAPQPTNWQSVQNLLLDDSSYVYSPTISDYDLYVPDPNLNSPLVHVLQLTSGMRQDDSTQREVVHVIKTAGTEYDNPNTHFLNTTFTYYESKWELNPDTGVSFTGLQVNGLEVGFKIAS